ncbi:MAG: ASKHA domain-containing protein [Chloroflexota bacterium]|nr:ASKHA domain-containing protein [Chloroflexota bacterium]MDH5242514.1 ASKHA domain-containing protein [Chloroflexota bacterium]
MTDADPQVIFTPSGRRGRVPSGTTVLDAARSLGVDIDSVCGGRGICGRCAVAPAFGDFAKHGISSAPSHLSEPGEVETTYRWEVGLAPERRLACVARLVGDAVVDVPPESQVHRQVVRKDLDARPFELDPVVRLHTVDVVPPDLATPTGDLGRLFDALRTEWRLDDLRADLLVIRALQPALTKGDYRVTVAVRGGRDIIAVWPGYHDRAFGVAIDVGSTTIAGHLANLVDGTILASAGVMNPQIRFGEDLMSRVSYVMMHEGGDRELTDAVRKALDGLLATLANRAGIKRAEVLELTLVGNPIMHHLVLGIDPTPLGSAPFALATDEAVEVPVSELGLHAHPGARAYFLPCIAGHVGADTAGVILAEEPHLADRLTLVVDVGTNAEIVLGDRRRLLAASSPTGPAFEGAQISAGQRAAPGAIERVRIDPASLEPRFRVIGVDAWSDAPDFAEQVADAGTGVTGICGSGIIEVVAELYLAGVVTADGVIDGALAARSPRVIADGRTFSYVLHDPGPGSGASAGRQAAGAPSDALGLRILVTQGDVRAIQLAKAALYAGVRLLMDKLAVDTVDDVRLAGAFGSQIDPLHAMILGLVPDCELDHVRAAGNAAGTGALIALLSGEARREIEAVVRRVEKVETAVEPRFQEHFVEALAIPHRSAPNPNLERVVTLPARPATADRGADPRAERHRRRAAAAAANSAGGDE